MLGWFRSLGSRAFSEPASDYTVPWYPVIFNIGQIGPDYWPAGRRSEPGGRRLEEAVGMVTLRGRTVGGDQW